MPYDEELAGRVRKSIAGKGTIEEKKAFGGLSFMMGGKMCVGVQKNRLMVRIDPEKHDALIKRRGAGPMDFTGRPMRGFLFIDAEGVPDAGSLNFWVNESVEYVHTVQAKKKKRGKRRKGGAARETGKKACR
jgi:TfoX/Sxy family transcriptional regulator of competence genes